MLKLQLGKRKILRVLRAAAKGTVISFQINKRPPSAANHLLNGKFEARHGTHLRYPTIQALNGCAMHRWGGGLASATGEELHMLINSA